MDTYLGKSGGAIGTKSFVKLVRALEAKVRVDNDPSLGNIQSRLAMPEIMSPQDETQLATAIDQKVADLRGKRQSPISDSALKQFQSLANAMSWHAKPIPNGDQQVMNWREQFMAFDNLVFPSVSKLNPADAVASPEAPRTFAMGDADGSMGRMVLHALASGVAELPPDQMPALARLINAEISASLDLTSGLQKFQSDPQVSQDLDAVAEALIVQPRRNDDAQSGKPVCVFLGDILSDRFTNNQQALSKFIYKLSGVDPNNPGARADTGVRFIAGNHDTQPLLGSDGKDVLNKKDPWAADWGAHAAKKLSLNAYKNLLADCFQAADYSDGVLTTHNGVAKGKGANEYLVGVGGRSDRKNHPDASGGTLKDCLSLTANSPKELAEKMNQVFLQRVRAAGPDDVISTDFRPNDSLMTPAALGFDSAGFRQLHGHSADANEDNAGVTNLNARGEQSVGGFQPMGTVLRYAAAVPPVSEPPAQEVAVGSQNDG